METTENKENEKKLKISFLTSLLFGSYTSNIYKYLPNNYQPTRSRTTDELATLMCRRAEKRVSGTLNLYLTIFRFKAVHLGANVFVTRYFMSANFHYILGYRFRYLITLSISFYTDMDIIKVSQYFCN